MSIRSLLFLCATAALAACTGGQDDYPALLPTAQMLAAPTLPAHAAVATTAPPEEALSARATTLRAQADKLRRPVIDPATQARMDRVTQE